MEILTVVLPVHVLGGTLGIAAGFAALFVAKGTMAHRRIGLLFVVAMLTMSLSGALMAAAYGQETNTVMGLLTAYLVVTAMTTVRPITAGVLLLERAAMLSGLALGVALLSLGTAHVLGRYHSMDMPGPMFFVFGGIALSAGLGDLRVMRSGPLRRARQLARHLWRMCFALLIATASLFLGQPGVFPEALRGSALLGLPVLAVVVAMAYWFWRVRFGPGMRRRQPTVAREALAARPVSHRATF